MQTQNGHHSSPVRREALKRILRDRQVRRQADIVRALKGEGFAVTQSSVSRDLRELGVAKVGDRYVLAEETPAPGRLESVAAFVREVRTAGASLTVVKTAIGTAPSVALAIDRERWPEVVGTLSGDDTLFIATAGGADQKRLLARLKAGLHT